MCVCRFDFFRNFAAQFTKSGTMILIKKLDMFILKKFLLIFFGAFFITLFVFMMQFVWRSVDTLIGKGLTVDVLGEFFWYMGISLVPMSLPMGVLLASLISFGNMGEQLELLAMKAAGVSLARIMAPVAILVIALTGTSFYFQNFTAPEAQLKLRTLLLSMKQTSPALEIPEGVFYNGVPGYNFYVEHKDVASGMLYNLMIYKTDQGFDKAQIVVADSGRLEMSTDKLHLVLDIWDGEQFENLESSGQTQALGARNTPYDRESFCYKRFLIDFDSNFEKMDEDQLRGMAQAKNLKQIEESVDSMERQLDTIGIRNFAEARRNFYRRPELPKAQEAALKRLLSAKTGKGGVPEFDRLMSQTAPDRQQATLQQARTSARQYTSELEWKSLMTKEGDSFIRRHWKEWNGKFTSSLACFFFFLVGAPLGSIIRRGGLGISAAVSVLIFIVYHIIDTSGTKMARDGVWNMVYGTWLSTFILASVGIFLSYKANFDSMVFNMEAYLGALKHLLGFRSRRHIFRKEVIINDPDYAALTGEIAALRTDCTGYAARKKLYLAPNYIRVFFRSIPDKRMERIGNRLERLIEELSNTKSPKILEVLNTFPVIYVHAHTSPFDNRRLNVISGVLFPVGIVLWLRIWRFRLRLHGDLRTIVKGLDELETLVKTETNETTSKEI